MATGLTFAVSATGTATDDDRVVFRRVVAAENTRRGRQSPPGTPLPDSTASERRASFLEILTDRVQGRHARNITENLHLEAGTELDQDDRDRANRAFIARRALGESKADILADWDSA